MVAGPGGWRGGSAKPSEHLFSSDSTASRLVLVTKKQTKRALASPEQHELLGLGAHLYPGEDLGGWRSGRIKDLCRDG